jgi:cytochrome c
MAMAAPAGPDLGQPATAAEIAVWDMDVGIDGTGLPPGEGTVEGGQALYETHCEACHGPEGIGGSADELAGSDEPLDSDWPDKTIGTYWPYATTLFDFIRRSKPMNRPGTLSDDQVYALTAYLLYLNDIILEDARMSAVTLPAVVMPNRDGFISCYPEPQPAEEARWHVCNP